jgi:hypothetical protein
MSTNKKQKRSNLEKIAKEIESFFKKNKRQLIFYEGIQVAKPSVKFQ